MKTVLMMILLMTASCQQKSPSKPSQPKPNPTVGEVDQKLSQMPKHRLFKEEWRKFLFEEIPKHKKLMQHNKSVKFWMATFMAMVETESWFRPQHRYVESGLGKDLVTGKQNTSEGLLQLSYQDAAIHGCDFDWSKDKNLGDKDKNKTIFDPIKNLACGLKIMGNQIEKRGSVTTTEKPYYWAVLHKSRPRHSKFVSAVKRYLNQ